MEWYWIVFLTIVVYNIIGTIFGLMNKEDWCVYWASGIVYLVLRFVAYPIRAIKTYNRSCTYYQKRGISKVQYLFGKRVKDDDQLMNCNDCKYIKLKQSKDRPLFCFRCELSYHCNEIKRESKLYNFLFFDGVKMVLGFMNKCLIKISKRM